MTRLEHKVRIKKQQRAFKNAHRVMEKIWRLKNHFSEGSVFKNGLKDLEAERRYNKIKQDLELFLQEAMDDGYPELTI